MLNCAPRIGNKPLAGVRKTGSSTLELFELTDELEDVLSNLGGGPFSFLGVVVAAVATGIEVSAIPTSFFTVFGFGVVAGLVGADVFSLGAVFAGLSGLLALENYDY